MKKSPQYYGTSTSTSAKAHLHQLCNDALEELSRFQLVDLEHEIQSEPLRSTEFGDVMARLFVPFDTMRIIMGLRHKAKMSEIVRASSVASRANVAEDSSSQLLLKPPHSAD